MGAARLIDTLPAMRILFLALAFAALAASAQTYPSTQKKPAATTYHGVEVRDDYQWLERWLQPRP